MIPAGAIQRLESVAELRLNEPMYRHTSYRIGGPADLYLLARSHDQLRRAVLASIELDLPCFLLGRGSNLLVSDAGIRGVVIENRARSFRIWPAATSDRWWIEAESGAALPELARQTAQRGLTGLEWGVGIPGTVGGGVEINAGAHGGCVGDRLDVAAVLYPDGRVVEETPESLEYRYRSTALHCVPRDHRPRPVVLWARFMLDPADPATCLARVEEHAGRRRATQPSGSSGGSVFKNPPGDSAGRLIDACGLKGYRIGNAQISPVHANFVVNLGRARSSDVRDLMELARERVRAQFGVGLELENELVGEW